MKTNETKGKRVFNSRKRNSGNPENGDSKKKGFSKQNFRKEVRDSNVEKKSYKAPEKQKRVYTPQAEQKYQFSGNPVNIFYGTITQASEQRKGYAVLSYGQCVKIEQFDNPDNLCRITAEDGRVGVISFSCVKRLNFSAAV